MSRLFDKLRGRIKVPSGPLGYEAARALVADGNAEVRRRVARKTDVAPEILYYLAEDPEPAVRREIAANGTAPPHADLLLAKDRDGDVRAGLARKVARLAPGLTAEQQGHAGAMILETLETLARDTLPRVRRVLAEELSHFADVPAHLVERLARDDVPEVAAPVLEFSPLLTEEFLVELIGAGAAGEALGAIARRARLGPAAADSIVARGEEQAITWLLKNGTAQIREETLDALAERAAAVPAWHEPLVGRPALSARAMLLLAEFVADALIERLARRDDVDPATAEKMRATVRVRLNRDATATSGAAFADDASLMARAKEMREQGRLDEAEVLRALSAGERAFVAAALAVVAGLPLAAVQKAVSLKSAKGLVAIAWKAGLTPEAAVQLQLRLAHLAPSAVRGAGDRDRFPLSEDEMRWQLDYFAA